MKDRIPMHGFGLAHIRGEGKPIHPDDINYTCFCDKCQEHYYKQLEAYNDAYGIIEEEGE